MARRNNRNNNRNNNRGNSNGYDPNTYVKKSGATLDKKFVNKVTGEEHPLAYGWRVNRATGQVQSFVASPRKEGKNIPKEGEKSQYRLWVARVEEKGAEAFLTNAIFNTKTEHLSFPNLKLLAVFKTKLDGTGAWF